MPTPKERQEEERDRQRNNENGDHYPTPREDHDSGVAQHWYGVGHVHDPTDDLDGKRAPKSK